MKIIKFDTYKDGGTQIFTCDNGKSYVVNHMAGDESNHGKLIVGDEIGVYDATIDDVNNLAFAIENMTLVSDNHDMNHYMFYGRVNALDRMSQFYNKKLNHVAYRLEREYGYFITCDKCSNILYIDDVDNKPLDEDFEVECECGNVSTYQCSSLSFINGRPSIRQIKNLEN